jgi:YaiO family outer membrane protein
MTMSTTLPPPIRQALAALTTLTALAGLAALPRPAAAQSPAPSRTTLELSTDGSRLSAGLPRGQATRARGSWALGSDTIVSAELLSERKFDARGGVVAAGVTQTLDPDWFVSATLAGGWGGPNWARQRVDLAASRKWGAERRLVTTLAGYHGRFDAGRSDSGLRVSANYYFNHFAVFEAGATFNRSNPGRVRSTMPYAALTLGTEGLQYVSLRVARGSEAWQVLGGSTEIQDFDSQTYSLDWRWWVGPAWGVLLRAERYLNPSYHRTTVGGGVFMQM